MLIPAREVTTFTEAQTLVVAARASGIAPINADSHVPGGAFQSLGYRHRIGAGKSEHH